MSSDEQDTGDDRARDGARSSGRRDPDRERRAAERARRIRERRAAERRAGRRGTAGTPADTDDHTAAADHAAAADHTAADADDGATDDGAAGTDRAGTAGRGRGRGAAAAVRERTAARAAERSRSRDPRYRRRRLVALLATAAVVLLGVSAAGWWALGRYGPPVATVRVDGTRQIPVRDVEDAAGDQTGVPLAAVDTDGVAARVSAIPGVAAVEVDRSWPDTLVVVVTERTPAAVLDTPDGPKLVDVTGFVYRDAPPDVRLPRLQLPRIAPDDPATLAAVGVLQALPVPVRDQVQTLSLGGGGSTFELGLTEDRRVLWGPWADTGQTAARARVLGPVLQRPGAVYDVSSPSLVTVRQR